MDGRMMHCGIISSCQSAATSEIVKRSWACVHRGAALGLYQVPDLYLYLYSSASHESKYELFWVKLPPFPYMCYVYVHTWNFSRCLYACTCLTTSNYVAFSWRLYYYSTPVVDAQLMAMRDVMQGDENNPKVPMENNCRLQMPINNRVVRTNINFRSPVIHPISKNVQFLL